MDIVAKYSSYRLGNIKIAIFVLLGLSVWFVYDGYYNQKFIDKHTSAEGKADDTLIVHKYFAYFSIPIAAAAAAAFFVNRKKQIVASQDALLISEGCRIPYDVIEEVDHTDFDTSEKFSITYAEGGVNKKLVLSKKKWDGLDKVLEYVISKIS